MKKLLFTIIVCLFSLSLLSQSCLPEGITFTTQEQIDNFRTENPNCTEIEGDVAITGLDIVNLNGLSVLNSIDSSLLIYETSLITLEGLDNMASVGGDFSIGYYEEGKNCYGNPLLQDLSGIDNLTFIGGSLSILCNNAITNLVGLDGVNTLEGGLSIAYNDALLGLDGLDGLNSIGGNLSIDDNDALTSLAELEGISSVGGGLSISNNEALTSLTGLGGITSIDEWISIYNNKTLASLTGLEGITSIGGRLSFTHNDALTNLTGLDGVASIGGDLTFEGNDALTSLVGLEGISTIGGRISIIYNDALTSLTGLEGLNSIEGYLGINGNDSLTSLTGLEGVTSIGGLLSLVGNHSLTSLEGIDNIDAGSIEELTIRYNSVLSTCEVQSICDYLAAPNGEVEIYDNAPGCNSVEEVEEACLSHCLPEGITFTTQAQIDSFQILYPNCTEIEGRVEVQGDDITNLLGLNNVTSVGKMLVIGGRFSYLYDYNPLLTSLDGLDNLVNVGGTLGILGNLSLVDLSGLENLNSVGGLVISSNHKLASLNGLNNLSSINDGELWIGGFVMDLVPFAEIQCSGNPSLTDISALQNISTVKNLNIHCNDSLSDLAGLENLTTVEESLSIGFAWDNEFVYGNSGNHRLISLSGIESITTIGGEISIQGNDFLEDVMGLKNINEVLIDSLTIRFNHSLSTCEASVICDYLALANANVSIHDNAPGCNSEQEVEDACASSISEIGALIGLAISPNPFTTSTTLSYTLKQPSTVQLSIFNQLGQLVYQYSEEQKQGSQQLQWDAQDQAEGLYYYQLKAGDQTATGKMVKVR